MPSQCNSSLATSRECALTTRASQVSQVSAPFAPALGGGSAAHVQVQVQSDLGGSTFPGQPVTWSTWSAALPWQLTPAHLIQPRGEWEFPFPTIPRDTSVSFPFLKVGNAILIPILVPKYREYDFSFPFPFPKFGNGLS